jgi:hypothetical protein
MSSLPPKHLPEKAVDRVNAHQRPIRDADELQWRPQELPPQHHVYPIVRFLLDDFLSDEFGHC